MESVRSQQAKTTSLTKSFETLVSSLTQHLETLREISDVHDIDVGSASHIQLQHLSGALGAAERRTKNIHEQIKLEKENIATLQQVYEDGKEQQEYLIKIRESLPKFLPSARQNSDSNSQVGNSGIDTENDYNTLHHPAQSNNRNTQECNKVLPDKPSRSIKVINFVTTTELDDVPKCLRGRVKLSKVNEAVAHLNKLIKRKYDFLERDPRKMSRKLSELYRNFMEQKNSEIQETEKQYFFVAKDLIRTDAPFNNSGRGMGKEILRVLRHTGRLKVLVGGGWNRFILQ